MFVIGFTWWSLRKVLRYREGMQRCRKPLEAWMANPRTLLVRGKYLPVDTIQQITLSTDTLPLTATVLMHDGTQYDFVGEEADAVRTQSEGLDIVTTTPVQHEIINTLPEEFRPSLDDTPPLPEEPS